LRDRYGLFFILALLLAGCASAPVQQAPKPPIPEVMPPIPEAMPQLPGESNILAPTAPAPEPKPVMSGNKAVIALLDRAQLDYEGGKREAAGASLERALRIEPRNPWLWHELAQLRLTQGQYAQAITLAQKSTSFAAREPRLRALNWRVIGNARVAQGDSTGAEQAYKQAAELEQPGGQPTSELPH
jgi:predicted Zn-dependent protease